MSQMHLPGAEPRPDDGPLSCMLTYEAGRGAQAPKRNKTAPLREFLTDSDYYYRLVFNHVNASCERGWCTPDAVLAVYLRRRMEMAKFHGETSSGLCQLALRYEGIGASPALVRQFFMRAGFPDAITQRTDYEPAEAVLAARLVHGRWVRERAEAKARGWQGRAGRRLDEVEQGGRRGSPAYPLLVHVARLFDGGVPLPEDDGELLRLAEVASVMVS